MESFTYEDLVETFSKYLLSQFEKDPDRAFPWLLIQLSSNFPDFAKVLSKSEPFVLQNTNLRLVASKNIEVSK